MEKRKFTRHINKIGIGRPGFSVPNPILYYAALPLQIEYFNTFLIFRLWINNQHLHHSCKLKETLLFFFRSGVCWPNQIND